MPRLTILAHVPASASAGVATQLSTLSPKQEGKQAVVRNTKKKKQTLQHQHSNPVEAFIKKWKLISCQLLFLPLMLLLFSQHSLTMPYAFFVYFFYFCHFCFIVAPFFTWLFINFLLSDVGRDTMKLKWRCLHINWRRLLRVFIVVFVWIPSPKTMLQAY